MPAVRILHCGESIENYNVCLQQKTAGFTTRSPQCGDWVYIAVRTPAGLVCGARMKLGAETDVKPWPDASRYPVAFRADQIEYADPFDLSFLGEVGGSHWGVRFLQRSKAIHDQNVVNRLAAEFDSHRTSAPMPLPVPPGDDHQPVPPLADEIEDFVGTQDEDHPMIMGTFQVVPFSTETDPIRGLEALVNNHFHELFPQFAPEFSILIPENRMFSTRVSEQSVQRVVGVNGVPDGVLITFHKRDKIPLRLSLLEYECFGERNTSLAKRTKYLNETVIPQLLRFASAFSCVTDQATRERTIQDWAQRIHQYVSEDDVRHGRMVSWIRELNPSIRESAVALAFQNELRRAFESHIRILLVIDELGDEHKETIRNVIRSFRLPSDGGPPVEFDTYIVRLVQRVNVLNRDHEYGLIFQA